MKSFLILFAALALTACSGDPGGEKAEEAGDAFVMPDSPTITPTDNQAPDLHRVGNKEVVVGETLDIYLSADDPDGDSLTFSVYGDMPPGGKFIKGEARFTWTPAQLGGPYLVTFVASDGQAFDSETVQLRAVNTKTTHPPVFVPVGDQVLEVGKLYELHLEATDEDGDKLVFAVHGGLPPGGVFEAETVTFRWTPSPDQDGDEHRVTFTVTDGQYKDSMDVLFIVGAGSTGNHPPTLSQIPPQGVQIDKAFSYTLQAQDPDGDDLTFGIEGDKPAGAVIDPNKGIFTWTPGSALAGQSISILFTASDGTYTAKTEGSFLVQGGGGACTDDEFEANNTPASAKQINPGTFAGLSVCDTELSPIDEDWFSLLLTSGTKLSVTVQYSSADGDLELDIFNTEGLVLANSPLDSQAPVEAWINDPGTYLIRIYGTVPTKYSVPYTLIVATEQGDSCPQDASEPNGDFSAAQQITNGDELSNLWICPGDVDMYKFTLQAGDEVAAGIDFELADGDLDLYLIGPDQGTVLDSSETGINNETVVLESAETSGTFYLMVSGYPFDTTQNSYSLDLLIESASPCTADAQEPNDSKGQATPVQSDQLVEDLSTCADADWFSVDVSGGDEVEVMIIYYAPEGGQPALELELPDGATIKGTCNTDSCEVTGTTGNAGAAAVKITGKPGITYDLAIVVTKDQSSDSCEGLCGQNAGSCWCDDTCEQYGDCCDDACVFCGYDCSSA